MMQTLRFIPEYAPMRALALSFKNDFYNTRFHYGKAQAQIIAACNPLPVEMYLEPGEMDAFRAAVGEAVMALPNLRFSPVSAERGILLEAAPIFAEDESGQRVGLVFHNPKVEESEAAYRFRRWFAQQHGFSPLDLGFDFCTAKLFVNEDLVLLSSEQFKAAEGERKLKFFKERFPGYHYHVVPPLAGDTTCDLDMFLWPIRPKIWIVSQYPAGSAQEQSIASALEVLAHYGHTVHRVPGLEPIQYDDINTMPNYANGVLLNRLALVPSYGRAEDAVVQDILRGYCFEVNPIDCRDIILTNSAIHCISIAVPD